jgi:hypothetical protein
MAVRCGDQCQTAEPEPAWLNDMPKPADVHGIKPKQETIPSPPAKASEGSSSGLGEGFKLQPADHSDAAGGSGTASKPELGEGFKLEAHAPQGNPANDNSKPEIKGLEPSPEKPAPTTPNSDGPTPAPPQGKSPAAARFDPEPAASDTTASALPSLLPPE